MCIFSIAYNGKCATFTNCINLNWILKSNNSEIKLLFLYKFYCHYYYVSIFLYALVQFNCIELIANTLFNWHRCVIVHSGMGIDWERDRKYLPLTLKEMCHFNSDIGRFNCRKCCRFFSIFIYCSKMKNIMNSNVYLSMDNKQLDTKTKKLTITVTALGMWNGAIKFLS